jgi:hypothetical protein
LSSPPNTFAHQQNRSSLAVKEFAWNQSVRNPPRQIEVHQFDAIAGGASTARSIGLLVNHQMNLLSQHLVAHTLIEPTLATCAMSTNAQRAWRVAMDLAL